MNLNDAFPEAKRARPFAGMRDLAFAGIPIVESNLIPRGMAMLTSGWDLESQTIIVGVATLAPIQQARLEYNRLLNDRFPRAQRGLGCGYRLTQIFA